MLLPTSLPGGLDDLTRDDLGVRLNDPGLFELARDALQDEMAEAKSNFGHHIGWGCR